MALSIATAESPAARPIGRFAAGDRRTAPQAVRGTACSRRTQLATRSARASRASVVGCNPRQRNTRLGAAAGAEAPAGTEMDTHVAVLHRAAEDPSVPKMEVFKAMMALEKMKLPADGFQETITAGGKRWRLVYTADKEAVAAALKAKGGNQELAKAGKYFPLTAVQSWDGAAGRIENGVYLGHVANLRFSGPFYMHDKKLSFDFTKLSLRLGPLTPAFDIKSEAESDAEFKRIAEAKGKGAKSPFFLFTYADDKIAIARGKGGGIAMWAAATPVWLMRAGVV